MRRSDPLRLAFGWLVLVGSWSLGLGCGPSFQAIYEGDAHFEHCYALDDTPSTPMPEKSACWKDWSQRYTYGQTRDRVEYAAARHRALSRVHGAPTDEAMMEAAPGEGSQNLGVVAPAPTSAFAPPPKTLAGMDAGVAAPNMASQLPEVVDPGGSPPVVESAPPGAECSEGCTRTWRSCSAGCAGKTCDACQKTYRACMKGCFKAERTPRAPTPKAKR